MIIIPAIDIMDGKCVRLTGGEFNTAVVYYEDPLEIALEFEKNGLQRLHLVDLDGARNKQVMNWQVLERLASNTSLQIDFSGGIKDKEDVQRVFDSGAAFVSIGSMAVKQPGEVKKWIKEYGGDKFLLGADLRNGKVALHGWQESSEKGWKELITEYHNEGLAEYFCTDISRDGMLEGPAIELYKEIMKEFPSIKLIASGGVSSLADLQLLEEAGLYAAIVGKAIYENRITLEQLKQF